MDADSERKVVDLLVEQVKMWPAICIFSFAGVSDEHFEMVLQDVDLSVLVLVLRDVLSSQNDIWRGDTSWLVGRLYG